MEALIKTLPSILRTADESSEVTEMMCRVAWNHAVGESLGHNAVAISLRDHTLIIGVHDRIWQKQLQAMMGQLISRVNSVLGQRLIKVIEFRIDPEALAQSRTVHTAEAKDSFEIPADLLSSAASIADPHLRKLFLDAATLCLTRRESSDDCLG
jgi:predicted nucleic acid-binding Zn ribbon protein